MTYAKRNKSGVCERGQAGVEDLTFVGKCGNARITLAHGKEGWFYGYTYTLRDSWNSHTGYAAPTTDVGKPLGMGRCECLNAAIYEMGEMLLRRKKSPANPGADINALSREEILGWLLSLEYPMPEQLPLFEPAEAVF